ncbi:alpha/beta hydrolase fold domain protein, partial [Mycobacterium xenopi 4042]
MVFVHGVYVTGTLWTTSLRLSDRYRCIAPTWPFGAQRKPVGRTSTWCRGAGRRILGLLEAL